MTLQSRRSSSIDLGRLVAAVRGPNVDTRIWKSYAYAAGDSQVDSKHGVFVDVVLLPGGEEMTAKVGSPYAGSAFGFYGGKIHKDDLLEISIPLGDPDEGAFVDARHWSAGFLPPQEAIDHPDDVLWIVEKDKTFRTVTSGQGKWYAKSEEAAILDSPKVYVGEENADQAMLLGTDFRDKQKTMNQSLQSAIDDLGTAIQTLGTSLTFAGVLVPAAAAAAKAAVTAFAAAGFAATQAMSMAVSQFESDAGSDQDFLSGVGFVKK